MPSPHQDPNVDDIWNVVVEIGDLGCVQTVSELRSLPPVHDGELELHKSCRFICTRVDVL